MSIEVLQDNLCVNRLIEGKKKEITLESSIIVPDIKPDIVKPIDLSGNVCIYKKEIINGRVKIDGTIDSNIIYLVDSGDELIRGLNSNIDFSEFLEIDSNISQADIDAKDHQFDALWQSIYDVCKLIKFGIIEDITEEEFEEAYAWLKTTQSLTEDYQEFELEF